MANNSFPPDLLKKFSENDVAFSLVRGRKKTGAKSHKDKVAVALKHKAIAKEAIRRLKLHRQKERMLNG